MTDYAEFLRAKIKMASFKGFTVEPSALHPTLYPHQRDIVRWAVQGGNRAVFAKFGLGKSVMQCEWMRQIIGAAGGLVHRVQRFQQPHRVRIDIVYSEAEREVLRTLQQKWTQHEEMVRNMTEIIKKYGLNQLAMQETLARSIGVQRIQVTGERFAVRVYSIASSVSAPTADAESLTVIEAHEAADSRRPSGLCHVGDGRLSHSPLDACTAYHASRAGMDAAMGDSAA